MTQMRVVDVMTAEVATILDDDTVRTAAKMMAEQDIGALPVARPNDELIGILTDRDIVVSAIALGKDPATTAVGEILTGALVCVDVDESVDRASELMATHQVRRLPVVDAGRVVGIVSQGDIARTNEPHQIGKMVRDISKP